MAYQIQPKAPTLQLDGREIAVGAFVFQDPSGQTICFGIFDHGADGWIASDFTQTYLNPGDLINDMRAKGGSVEYLKWLVAKLNAALKKLFSLPEIPVGEPTTDDEVLAFIQNSLAGMTLTNVAGVPKLG